jgi:hypothetical protein
MEQYVDTILLLRQFQHTHIHALYYLLVPLFQREAPHLLLTPLFFWNDSKYLERSELILD